jgi:hypothetical protein
MKKLSKIILSGAILGSLFLILISGVFTAEVKADPTNKPVKVFIMLGQSNMFGTGGQVIHAPPAWRVLDGVLFDETLPGTAASSSWEQIGIASANMGPEVSFAAHLRDSYPNNTIAIIKVSKPGTGLGYWRNPGSEGYDTLMSRMDVIKTRLDQSVAVGDIPSWSYDGIVSVQGENEADGAIEAANTYLEDFEDLISKIRVRAGVPNLPAIVSRASIKLDPNLGGPVAQPQLDTVRSLQQQWAESQPYNNWVNTDDLMLIDSWHYGSLSQLTLGTRIARAWFDVAEQRPNVFVTIPQGNALKTANSFLEYNVKFSKPVTGFSNDDITIVSETGAEDVSLVEASPFDGTSYTVRVAGMVQSGQVSIIVRQSASVSVVGSLPSLQSLSDNASYIYSPNESVAGLLAYDPLTASPRALRDLTSGFGWEGRGWEIQNNLINGYLTKATSLTYSGLINNTGSVSGGDSYQTAGRYIDLENTFRPYMQTVGSNAVDKQGTVMWMSYLIRPESNTLQRFSLQRGIGNVYTQENNMIRIEQSAGNWALGIMSRSLVSSSVNVTTNQTYLMVVRMELGGTTLPSRAHLWINPTVDDFKDGAVDLSSATISDSVVSGDFKFRRFVWYPGGSINNGSLDEIRIGLTPQSVAAAVPTAPLEPTGTTAVAGYLSARVTFDAPAENGGSPITGYTVQSHPAGGIDVDAGSTGLTHNITNLIAGEPYTFTVVAENAVGESLESDHSNTTIPLAPIVINPTTPPDDDIEVNDTSPPKNVVAVAPSTTPYVSPALVTGANTSYAEFINLVNNRRMAIEVDDQCRLYNVSNVPADDSSDSGYRYPMGLYDFTASCDSHGHTAEFSVLYYDVDTKAKYILRKYDAISNTYTTIKTANFTTLMIAGQSVLKVTYSVKDGSDLDADGIVNGVIVDPAGPALVVESEKPSSIEVKETSSDLFIPVLGILALLSIITFSIYKRFFR